MKLMAAIQRWYEGEDTPHENDPNSWVIFVGGSQKLHWTAKIARRLITFATIHWKFLITTTLAVLGLILGYMKL